MVAVLLIVFHSDEEFTSGEGVTYVCTCVVLERRMCRLLEGGLAVRPCWQNGDIETVPRAVMRSCL